MANQTSDDDFQDDVVDPDSVQAAITSQDATNQANAHNSFQLGNAVVQQGGNLIGQGLSQALSNPDIGDPRVVEARKISNAMKQIVQSSNADAPQDESPLEKQQRLASAVALGMADINPGMALKANMQAVAMQQAKQQQALITQQTRNVSAEATKNEVGATEAKANAIYQVHGMTTGKDGLPVFTPYGDPVSLYNDDGTVNPNIQAQLRANMLAAKNAGVENPVFSSVSAFENSKANVAMVRAQAQAAMADKKAAESGVGLTPDAVANSAVLSIVAPNTVTRFSRQDKEAIANFMAKQGIDGTTVAAAQSQMRALNAAAVAEGTRVGNIKTMEQSIAGQNGLADQVMQTLDKVDRTRYPALNAGIVMMKSAAGSGPEAAYHTAMQGLITEYARVISGGTGVTSDEARKQATDLLSTASSPEAVKAVVNQIKNGELAAIRNGSDQAIELIAHPERYGAIMRLQQKAGISPLAIAQANDPTMTPTYSRNYNASQSVARPGQTPSPTQGWGRAVASQTAPGT